MDSQQLNIEIDKRDIFTVRQLNRSVKELLQNNFQLTWVEGEISNLARPASGHIYFSLKDESAQVRCAMFRNSNRKLKFEPEDGMHVLVRARVGLYEPRGEYQLTVEHMEEAGIGLLQRKFEELKKKLDQEGLFDSSHKKLLPTFPENLAVITSATGAAIRDILSVLKRRYPILNVYIFAVQVQGQQSSNSIIDAIQNINLLQKHDIILLARGGGSIEDLWSFNEEPVARAIFASEIPIVTGIGHEIDFTIADFVADVRAPTPSAAAELIAPNQHELIESFDQYEATLLYFIQDKIRNFYQSIDWLTQRLELLHPKQVLERNKEKLIDLNRRIISAIKLSTSHKQHAIDKLRVRFQNQSPEARIHVARINLINLNKRLFRVIRTQLDRRNQQLISLSRTLDAISPLGTLDRGYAIVTKALNGQVLRNPVDVANNEKIMIQLAEGLIHARIDNK